MKYVLGVVVLIILALACGHWVIGEFQNYYTKHTVTDKILNEARVYDSKFSYYLIYGQNETYTDQDSIIYEKWNSSDIYGHLQAGHTYELVVYGWRIPFWSEYRNILSYKLLK